MGFIFLSDFQCVFCLRCFVANGLGYVQWRTCGWKTVRKHKCSCGTQNFQNALNPPLHMSRCCAQYFILLYRLNIQLFFLNLQNMFSRLKMRLWGIHRVQIHFEHHLRTLMKILFFLCLHYSQVLL